MKRILFILLFIVYNISFSQDARLAKYYFDGGDYEKSLVYYEKLHNKYPLNTSHLFSLVFCYQQLEKYDEAEKILLKALANSKVNTPLLHIEIGYNYSLKSNDREADRNYEIALKSINENASYAYTVGNAFRKKSLLEYAIKAFKLGMAVNPDLNFNYDLAYIYGEMGDIEGMYNTYLDLIAYQQSYLGNVQRNIGRFISDEETGGNNQLLKKLLLKRVQSDPNLVWNELLSWLFIQQKHFSSAFAQEKAIYKRSDEASLNRIIELGLVTLDEKDNDTARNIFQYVIENSSEPDIIIQSHLNIINIELKNKSSKKINEIENKFNSLLEEYGKSNEAVNLKIAYANFLAFEKEQPTNASQLLKTLLKDPLNKYDEAYIKMALGDILVYDEKFNQALIYYSQIQKLLKNDVLSQEARFKVAQTSFYKGDFNWAETQLKVLKSSTSQLIANDALQLKLLISDNSLEDSTQTALKIYAKASLLAYQNKPHDAIKLLNEILINHKGESIEDEALFKQAQLFEENKEYEKAKINYLKIIEFYSNGILADDAIFNLAELYHNYFNNNNEAMALYERIIFNHPDSIYYVESRKKYRRLRGDAIN
ncbi:tetratricopeptide repeat protein [Abyssalbus ytuae]|uniref:Tetratricopeptide repeat protein n=1 Tax=Abyssalbus ytuae TaxID=2926907 RepID=A0A9E6ZYF2_9FLAO|nr:tetratricopeptide repeat protein [Abyssalbus ytuae]UOB16191.1 tetratricopeptide repeat protein [Abyssalbus ytuae]